MSDPQNKPGSGDHQPNEPGSQQWPYPQQPQYQYPQYPDQTQYNPGGAYPPAAPPPGAQPPPQGYSYPAQYSYQPQYAAAPPRRRVPVWVWIVGGVAAVLLCACVAFFALVALSVDSSGGYYPGG